MISDTADELEDEEEKIADAEQRFKELQDQPFEPAAKRFIQDEDLPEPVRQEMKQIVEEVEDMEDKEGSLLQMVEQVEEEEEFELKELKEVGALEQDVEQELEEVAEEEAEAERWISSKREQVKEIQQDMREKIQARRQARNRGDRQTAQQAKQDLLEDRNRLEQIRDSVGQFMSQFEGSVGPKLQDAKSRLGKIREDLGETSEEAEEVEDELGEEEELGIRPAKEAQDVEGKAEEEKEELSSQDTTQDEDREAQELISDAIQGSENAKQLKNIVEEEIDEQENIERDEQAEAKEEQLQEDLVQEEGDEKDDIEEEGNQVVDEIDNTLQDVNFTPPEEGSESAGQEYVNSIRQKLGQELDPEHSDYVKGPVSGTDFSLQDYYFRSVFKAAVHVCGYPRLSEEELDDLVAITERLANTIEKANGKKDMADLYNKWADRQYLELPPQEPGRDEFASWLKRRSKSDRTGELNSLEEQANRVGEQEFESKPFKYYISMVEAIDLRQFDDPQHAIMTFLIKSLYESFLALEGVDLDGRKEIRLPGAF